LVIQRIKNCLPNYIKTVEDFLSANKLLSPVHRVGIDALFFLCFR